MPPDPRIALLDVNVLVALAWPNHVHHQAAHAWFDGEHRSGWATTPVTECGFVRVSCNRAAIAVATSPPDAVAVLSAMRALPGHVFWADDVPLVGPEPHSMRSHADVTDVHLIALAQRHDGVVVTFDRGLRNLAGSRAADLVRVLAATQ